MVDNTCTNDYYINRQDSTESNARSYPRKFPVSLKKAEGVWVEDVEGNKYLDALCGAGTLALGHNNPEINANLISIINSGIPLHTLDITTPIKDEFVQTLIKTLPTEMQNNVKLQFCSPSGTDAVDAALKLCKTATGRDSIIAFGGAYHGMGHGALSLTGNLTAKNSIHGLMPNVYFMPYPYSYRCPFGLGGDAGIDAACHYFERTLKDPESGITKPAAVILEPIQGEGGVIPAPKKFLQTIRRVTKELGIPLIADEIQCGVGRSGKFFAFEHADIIPDLVLVSKAIGGSQPLAVVIYNKELDKWKPGAHAGTFRGNQLAMSAGTVVMNTVNTEEFLNAVTVKGQNIRERLSQLKKNVSIIGDIRGEGLMIGVEIIDPLGTADHLGSKPPSGDLSILIQKGCFQKKLIIEKGGRYGSVIRFLCALNMKDDEIDQMLTIFEDVVIKVDENATR